MCNNVHAQIARREQNQMHDLKQHACVRRYLTERQDYCAQPTQTQRKIASNLHAQDIARREQCKSNKQNGRNVTRNMRAQV